ENICVLYGYRPWSSSLSSQLEQQAAQIVHRDVTPGFVATELIIWLNAHKIIRPGYTTLQELVSRVLSDERQRLGRILTEQLDDATIADLDKLIERDDTLSRLAVLRQDARDFGWRQMVHEREKRAILEPLHRKACDILPALNISQQNLLYYASLANFYTVYDLRNLKPEQTRLYLLCYAWIRYRQFSDNLVDAMFFHMKQLEDESRSVAKQLMADVQEKHRRETSKIGRLLSLYVDDSVPDPTTFGEVRRRAWKIMPPNDYEGHHVFDIWYRNTSEVKPTAITGDMHSINKANFAILHWFGLRFEPHFTDLNRQLQELYCTRDPSAYKNCLIQPAGQIDLNLITREKSNLDRIVATLGLKEMTQGTLIRKLCTYTT
ncbi:Tn3 family transposase, partial [Erwinia persicina]